MITAQRSSWTEDQIFNKNCNLLSFGLLDHQVDEVVEGCVALSVFLQAYILILTIHREDPTIKYLLHVIDSLESLLYVVEIHLNWKDHRVLRTPICSMVVQLTR